MRAGHEASALHPEYAQTHECHGRWKTLGFRELRVLKKYGFREFVLCVGYTSMIESYFGDGHALNISILYSEDGEKHSVREGALRKAVRYLQREFMVTYGDSFLQLDYAEFIDKFHSSGKLAIMAVLENHDNYGKSDIVVQKGLVTKYDKRGMNSDMIWINYGATLLRKEALDFIPESMAVDEEQFYRELIRRKDSLPSRPMSDSMKLEPLRGCGSSRHSSPKMPSLFEN